LIKVKTSFLNQVKYPQNYNLLRVTIIIIISNETLIKKEIVM